MTESDWLAGTEPKPMLEYMAAGGKGSDRKLRLFACACCRRIWQLLTDARSRRAVEIAERYADGEVSDEQLVSASGEAASVGVGFGIQYSPANATHFAARPGRVFADRCAMFAARAVDDPAEPMAQADLLRCLWGNPFRDVSVAPSLLHWNSGTVVTIAQSLYDDQRFADLPVLADALEEAGCESAELLTHCRRPGPHYRGCWVLDLLVRKV